MLNLTNIIKDGIEVQEREPRPRFYCSRFGLCKRSSFLSMTPGLEKAKDSPLKYIMFGVGKFVEEMVLESARKSGIIHSSNVKISDYLPDMFGGEYDALINHEGKFYIWEIKASHPNAVKYKKEPKSFHLLQAKSYIYALRNSGVSIDSGFVSYFSRGGEGEPVHFPFDYTEDDVKFFEEEFDNIERMWLEYTATGFLPDKVPMEFKSNRYGEVAKKLNWECTYCEHKGYSCNPEG